MQSERSIQIQLAYKYLLDKAGDGALLGLIFILIAQIDKRQSFTNFIHGYLTEIPVSVVIAGYVGLGAFFLSPTRRGVFAKLCRAWFDLVQQFFTLGVGAYWPLKIGIWLAHPIPFSIFLLQLGGMAGQFSLILVGALLAGLIWAVRERPITLLGTRMAGCLVFLGVLLLFMVLNSAEGGRSYLSIFL